MAAEPRPQSKPFACDVCFRQFGRAEHLRRHVRARKSAVASMELRSMLIELQILRKSLTSAIVAERSRDVTY